MLLNHKVSEQNGGTATKIWTSGESLLSRVSFLTWDLMGLRANPYMQNLREQLEHCTILGTIPQTSVTDRRQ